LLRQLRLAHEVGTYGFEKLSPHDTATREPTRGSSGRGEKVKNQGARVDVEQIADIAPTAPTTLESLQLGGAMSRTLFGNLNGVYTLECEQVPSEEEICQALRLRVHRDCGQLRDRDDTELAAWHGGWTCEGIGIFSADIWCRRSGQRARHLGRACVKVQTPRNSGSRTWNGIAC
jgi:hypothetical protein